MHFLSFSQALQGREIKLFTSTLNVIFIHVFCSRQHSGSMELLSL